jgi:phenylacetate-CoA ligase
VITLTSGTTQALELAERERSELAQVAFDPAYVLHHQAEKLQLLWDRAADVPYYSSLPEFASRDLARLPVTPKDIVKADPAAFARSSVTAYAKYYESSGSSGIPTPTPRLAEDVVWNAVSVSALWGRTLKSGDRVASLVPSDVAPVGDLVSAVAENLGCSLLRCYPFAQGMCDWDRLEQLFLRYRPEHVFVAPGVLSQWTRILKQRGSLAQISDSVRSLMLLGEVSTRPLRARLGAAWGAAAVDVSYGSTETGTIGASCEYDRMHLLLAGHIVELRDGRTVKPISPGASGELVTTTLNNFARPLIRFGTGDVVTIGDGGPCPCGLQLPTMTVQGRQTEEISVRGAQVSVQDLESVVYGFDGVTGYLIQLRKPDGRNARLVLERDVDFTGDADTMCVQVQERFSAAGVHWDQVIAVSQLSALTKSGGSQKNWKRTNIDWVD